MQVVLNIDAKQIEKPVEDMLASLTVDDKRELAKSMVAEYFRVADTELDRQRDMEIVDLVRKADYYLRERPIDEVRKSAAYQNMLRERGTPRQKMMRHAIDGMVAQFIAEVKRMVSEDAQFKATVSTVNEAVKEIMPKAIQDALTLWVAANLDKAVSGVVNGIGTIWMQNPSGTGQERMPALSPEISNVVAAKMKESGITF